MLYIYIEFKTIDMEIIKELAGTENITYRIVYENDVYSFLMIDSDCDWLITKIYCTSIDQAYNKFNEATVYEN